MDIVRQAIRIENARNPAGTRAGDAAVVTLLTVAAVAGWYVSLNAEELFSYLGTGGVLLTVVAVLLTSIATVTSIATAGWLLMQWSPDGLALRLALKLSNGERTSTGTQLLLVDALCRWEKMYQKEPGRFHGAWDRLPDRLGSSAKTVEAAARWCQRNGTGFIGPRLRAVGAAGLDGPRYGDCCCTGHGVAYVDVDMATLRRLEELPREVSEALLRMGPRNGLVGDGRSRSLEKAVETVHRAGEIAQDIVLRLAPGYRGTAKDIAATAEKLTAR